MENPPLTPGTPPQLRDAMARRLYRRAIATGQITLPAVPAMIDEYVSMCEKIFGDLGVRFTPAELAHLRSVLEGELADAYAASPRSSIVIGYDCPFGTVLNYTVKAEWRTLADTYQDWAVTGQPPLFGIEPDARVWALAWQAVDPRSFRVLDIGAGTGRNALALARRGHPVDAVEMTPHFAETIRAEATRDGLDVHVIECDVFATTDDLRWDYQLILLSGMVSDFRTTRQLRSMFELAARCLAPGWMPGVQCLPGAPRLHPRRDRARTRAAVLHLDVHLVRDDQCDGPAPAQPDRRRLRLRVREHPPARGRVAAHTLVPRLGQRPRRIRRRTRGMSGRDALAGV